MLLSSFKTSQFADHEFLVVVQDPKETSDSAFSLSDPAQITGRVDGTGPRVMYRNDAVQHEYKSPAGFTYHVIHKNNILAEVQ